MIFNVGNEGLKMNGSGDGSGGGGNSGGGGGETGGSCFIAGTTIFTGDGEHVLVQNVAVGDVLRSQHGNSIVAAFDHPKLGERWLYSINDSLFFVTSEHPFYTKDGWKSIDPKATAEENPELTVGRLDIGDSIELEDGTYLDITEMNATRVSGDTQLYNFKLEGDNTYYANSMLVHNKDHGPSAAERSRRRREARAAALLKNEIAFNAEAKAAALAGEAEKKKNRGKKGRGSTILTEGGSSSSGRRGGRRRGRHGGGLGGEADQLGTGGSLLG